MGQVNSGPQGLVGGTTSMAQVSPAMNPGSSWTVSRNPKEPFPPRFIAAAGSPALRQASTSFDTVGAEGAEGDEGEAAAEGVEEEMEEMDVGASERRRRPLK